MSPHGWVTPRPDGAKTRCGGPGICPVCVLEAQGAKITPDVERLAIERSRLQTQVDALLSERGDYVVALEQIRSGAQVGRSPLWHYRQCVKIASDALDKHTEARRA